MAECSYCGGNCENDEDNACDGYLGDIDGLYGSPQVFTRADYVGSKANGWKKSCTHQEYYEQFTNEHMRAAIWAKFGNRLLTSTDPHLNDLNGYQLENWDRLGYLVRSSRIAKMLKDRGDYLTAAGIVCILKTAARQVIREKKLSVLT